MDQTITCHLWEVVHTCCMSLACGSNYVAMALSIPNMSALSRARARARARAPFIHLVQYHIQVGISGEKSEEPTVGGFNMMVPQPLVAWAVVILQSWRTHRHDIYNIIATWIRRGRDSLRMPASAPISRTPSLRSISSTTSIIVNISDDEETGPVMITRPPGLEELPPILSTPGICDRYNTAYYFPCICDLQNKEQKPTYRTWPGRKSRDGSYDLRKEENWNRCKGCGGCECGTWVPKYCKLCQMWLNSDIQHRNHCQDKHHHRVATRMVEKFLGLSINDMAASLIPPTPAPTWSTTLQMETILEDHQLPDRVAIV